MVTTVRAARDYRAARFVGMGRVDGDGLVEQGPGASNDPRSQRAGATCEYVPGEMDDSSRPMFLRNADFSLSEEQSALREAFRSFLMRECPSDRVRAAEPLGFDEKLWNQFTEMRAVAMGVPLGDGGDGAGMVELVLAAEEVGRSVAPVPFVDTVVAARLLARCGAAAQPWCEATIAGTKLVTIALRPLRAGRPQLVPAGAVADGVVALLDGDLVVVTRATPFERVANHGFAPLARVDVEDAATTVSTIASGAEAETAFDAAVREWKLLMAAAQVGIAAGALPLAVDFASSRVAFGVPIATFQAISHPLVDRYIGLVGARRLVWQAAWFTDHEPAANPSLVPMAFVYASRVAMATATTGVHTQGGLGFTLESDMQLYFRRAKGWANVIGDPVRELEVIADELYGPAHSV
jgi:alkylation response protein AidB-like acyl-CoA dehydrogenase